MIFAHDLLKPMRAERLPTAVLWLTHTIGIKQEPITRLDSQFANGIQLCAASHTAAGAGELDGDSNQCRWRHSGLYRSHQRQHATVFPDPCAVREVSKKSAT